MRREGSAAEASGAVAHAEDPDAPRCVRQRLLPNYGVRRRQRLGLVQENGESELTRRASAARQ
jgi:hypothetical protein